MCQKMTPFLKAQILDSLGKISGPSITAKCIKTFAKSAHLKTDLELSEMITDLQEQMVDHPVAMQSVLGDQFDFLNAVGSNKMSQA